jgi:hypothetical protein
VDHQVLKNNRPMKPLYKAPRYLKAAVVRFYFGSRFVKPMIATFSGNALRQPGLSQPGRQASFHRPSQKLKR